MASIGMMQSDEGKTIPRISAFGKKLTYVAERDGRASTRHPGSFSAPSDRTQVKCNVINPLNCPPQRSRGWPGQAWSSPAMTKSGMTAAVNA
jgi:hypothetical protein